MIAALLAIGERDYHRRITVIRHTNPAGDQLAAGMSGRRGIELMPPVGYPEMVRLLGGADLVLSDSGGLQEECCALGIPLLILRDNTERPEVIEIGAARLVGTNTREIVDAAEAVLGDARVRAAMSVPRFPYGTGDAATRVVDVIARYPFPDHDRRAAVRYLDPAIGG